MQAGPVLVHAAAPAECRCLSRSWWLPLPLAAVQVDGPSRRPVRSGFLGIKIAVQTRLIHVTPSPEADALFPGNPITKSNALHRYVVGCVGPSARLFAVRETIRAAATLALL